jgi:hypothetical protein
MDWAFLGLFRDRHAWRSSEAATALDVRDGAALNALINLRDHGLVQSTRLQGDRLMTWTVTRSGERYERLRAEGRSRREALRGADEVR